MAETNLCLYQTLSERTTPMLNIHLHGALKEFHPEPLKLNVANPVLATRAMCQIFGRKFEKMIRGGSFYVIRGEKDTSDMTRATDKDDYVTAETKMMPTSKKDLHFIPAIEGSGDTLRVIVGVVLIIVGIIFPAVGGYTIPAGIGLVLGGIAGMLTPKPKMTNYTDAQDTSKPSAVFNGAINVTVQGGPVPLVYGRFVVGTVVISAGVEVETIYTAPAYSKSGAF